VRALPDACATVRCAREQFSEHAHLGRHAHGDASLAATRRLGLRVSGAHRPELSIHQAALCDRHPGGRRSRLGCVPYVQSCRVTKPERRRRPMHRSSSQRVRQWVLVPLLLTQVGCGASTSSLTVTPLQGQEEEQVARDRAQCDAIAAQARDRWAFVKTKVIAFIGGGVGGAAFGVALPPFGTPAAVVLCAAAVGAAVGFVLGEIVGTVAGAEEHRKSESAYLDRYVRCLNERGY